MIPPSASTSRTTVPFATPPIAGLHDICPMVSSALVTIATRAPARAAATAASVPAWPAPTTMTSTSASLRAVEGAMPESYTEGQTRTGTDMPLPISSGSPTLFIRRTAYEQSGIDRSTLDERLGLTQEEFRVEGGLIAI